jgi:signal transduction histidine kinase
MSHELRTPMNAIIGYAHLLLDGLSGPLRPSQADDVRQIADGADRLLGLIDDVLDLSRIEAGRLDLTAEPVDLTAVVAEVTAQMAPLASRKGLDVVVDPAPGLPAVRADPLRVRQILLNLVGNAVKFTEAGSVRVTSRATEDGVEVAVTDTGIGIAPEVLPHVFDEFRQADTGTTRRYGGSGLGLAISRRLAELHGGTIAAESTPGVGSAFTLRLPVDAGDERPAG